MKNKMKNTVLYPFPSLSNTRLNTTVSPISMVSYEVRTEWKAIVSEIQECISVGCVLPAH